MHCAIPDYILLDKHTDIFSVWQTKTTETHRYFCIHYLQETAHSCRILTGKLRVFQFPTFRGILSSVTPSRDPSSIHILMHKPFESYPPTYVLFSHITSVIISFSGTVTWGCQQIPAMLGFEMCTNLLMRPQVM